MDLDRLSWIELGEERPVDADQRIVDPHHHLWERGGSRYLAEELFKDTSRSHNVTDTVFVECLAEYDKESEKKLRPLGETAFVVNEAKRIEKLNGTRISGIVSFADLALGNELDAVLVAHSDLSAGLLKGIRHATAWSDDPEISIAHTKPTEGLMSSKLFRDGVSKLSQYNYTFDSWIYFDQLGELVSLARSTPETTIIINHLAAPLNIGKWSSQTDVVTEIWKSKLNELSTCDNVYMKIGGIGMDNYFATGWATGEKPPSSDQVVARWESKILWCIETFGTKKCMFESNYPVDRQTLPYSVIWNAFQKITNSFTETEKTDLFSRTACNVYSIN